MGQNQSTCSHLFPKLTLKTTCSHLFPTCSQLFRQKKPSTCSHLSPLYRGKGEQVGGYQNRSKMSNSVFISTPAIPDICRKCLSSIWVAMVDGFRVKVEPTPINLETELKLRAKGVRIYQARKVVFQFELLNRHSWHIKNSDGSEIVLPAHDCKNPQYGQIVHFFEKPQIQKSEGIPF